MADMKNSTIEFIKTIVYALLIAGVFRTLFFQPFWIPTGSMKQTLMIGDFLFVNKMAYGYSRYSCPFAVCPISGRIFDKDPERGDVIVFRHPSTGEDYVKRLIGLPGDTIQMQNGLLSINGQIAPQRPDGVFEEIYQRQGAVGTTPICANGAVGFGGLCVKERAIETLPNGVEYPVLNVGNSPLDNTPIFTVPDGQYFFMGDNRDNSTDSRVAQPMGVGFVDKEYLLGRVDRVIFSSGGSSLLAFWTWRADRFFKAVE
ncbi:MAG: signal peptidase I [Paracoccaceae bacterium]